ncbi:MAG: hypothetical protein LBN39_08420 [Planctomycetaceae bacterium]|jgi:hypothetical protein|nr:hypothetical protein [Planctomycetaceae bacterium]
MTSPLSYTPARETDVLASSVRIFISTAIVAAGTAVAAMFLKQPVETAVAAAPVPAVSAPVPKADGGTGKVGQVYPLPLPAAQLPAIPAAIPVVEKKTKTLPPAAEWKGFADINTEFKVSHLPPKAPSVPNEPAKDFEKRMKPVATNELNDKMLALFQFADNLQPARERNGEPVNPFQTAEENGLRPLPQKDTMFELKPLRKVE